MKRKLLFAALCVVSALGFKANAQTDVTSTYLTNYDFSTGTPIDNHVCTYGKDMAANGTTYYSAQPIEGWTNASVGETDSGYANSKLAGALFAYGGTPWLAGSGNTAPATDPNGNAGNAAGLCAVWGGSIQYTQDVTLPAGSYTIVFKVYNKTTGSGNSSGVITTNLFGFIEAGSTTHYAPNNTFAIGQWANIAVTFNLAAETSGKISMGYVGPSGNAAMPHLFVDNVKIYSNDVYEDCTNKVNKSGWTGATDGYQGGTINTARQYGDKSVGRHIYQTINGLDNGIYEVALYSISQKEWNGTLANDAGNVAYVFADGAYELKEWINARARAAYPGDDNVGRYTISGVTVTDGTMTIGMGLDQANLTEWHHIQILSLIRTNNPDLSIYIELYENALSNAKTLSTSKMSTAALSTLNSAIDTYDEGKVSKTNQEALETATAALNTAIETANTSVANYAEAATILNAASGLDAIGQTTYTTNETVSALQTAYNNGTLVAVSAEQKTACQTALKAAAKAQTTAGADMTLAIDNWDFLNCQNGNFPGWQISTTGGYANRLNDTCVEYWTGTASNGGFDYYQEISGLPAGKYTITGCMWNSTDNVEGTVTGQCGVYGTSGTISQYKGVTADTREGGRAEYTTDELTVTNGTLRLGVKNNETMGARWFGVDYIKLTFVEAISLQDYYDQITALVGQADGITGKQSAATASELSAAKTEGEELVDEESTDIAALNASIDRLTNAIAASQTSVTAYANLNSALTTYGAKANTLDSDGQTAYNGTVSAIQTAYNNGTYSAEEATAASNNVANAYIAAIKAQTTPGGNWTELINNPSFETNNFNGWTNTGMATQGNTSFPGKVGNYYAETWQPNGTKSVKQTLNDLPIGSYRLSANALARTVTSAKIYVGSKETAITIKDGSDTYNVDFTCDNGADLEIGFEAVGTGAANSWICVDNFTLTYIGSMDDGFNAAVAEVTTLEGTIPTAAYNKAYAVVQKWLDDYPTTVAGFETAIAEIGDAATEAATCVAPYAVYNTKRAAVLALYNVDEYEELVADAHDALGTALSTAATNIAAAEDADDISTVTNTLKAAGYTYASNANPTNEAKPFDLTFLMVNPDLTGLPTWAPAAGWASEETDGNSQVMVNDNKTVGDKSYFYEYWSNPAKASGKFALYNAITLPAGTFAMSCYAFAENQYAAETVNGVYFYANDTQGSCVTATVLTQQELSFVNDTEKEVKIGLKTMTSGNNRNWMGIGYVELYKVPAKTYTVDETVAWDNTTSGAGDVTLNRNIKVGINTVVFPFSMTQEEVESTFGEGSQVYVIQSYNAESDNVTFEVQQGIAPNEPCLLKATVAGTTYDIEGRTIVAAASANPETTAIDGLKMVGNYNPSAYIPVGEGNVTNYVVSNNALYEVDVNTVAIKSTRAYFSLTATSAAKSLKMIFGGEATNVDAPEVAETEEEEVLYNMAGVQVDKNFKGFVINQKGEKRFNK